VIFVHVLSTLDSCPLSVEVLLEEALCICDEYCTVKKLWSLLKPLLTGCDQYYRGKRLCGVTLEVTVEEGYPVVGSRMLCSVTGRVI
jgi:hypothetical protein